ncbi:MAG: hypothetical protein IKS87_02060 [Lachnospiraceae bacterium]|nr:hypothetical protein [Lachnospiraceae bacterium]
MANTYEFNGVHHVFNKKKFRAIIENFRQLDSGKKLSLDACFDDISCITYEQGVSLDSLRNWIYGRGIPRDEGAVQCVADAITELYKGKRVVKPQDMLDPIARTGGTDDVDADDEEAVTGGADPAQGMPKRRPYTIDWTDTHSVVRSIYLMISRYVDEFKRTLAFETCHGNQPDCPSRDDIEEAIFDCMLDLPDETFRKLLDFCRGYLRDMNYYDDGYDLIWYRAESESDFPAFQEYYMQYCFTEEAEAEADRRMMEGIEDFDEYYESQRCIDPDELWKDYDPEEDPSNSYCDFIPLEEKKGYVQYVVDRTYEELASMLAEG